MDRITGLLPFVKTAELGSFVAAGRALGLSASAVGKSVTRLEQQVGVRLFQRTTRSLSLTDDGRQFHERCRRILEDFEDAQAALSHSTEVPRGRLRITLPIASYHLFRAAFLDFMSCYPEIEMEIDFSDQMVDLINEGMDIAIRGGELPDSLLMRRSLPPVQLLVCASPLYLERHGVPQVPHELADHAGVRFRFFQNGKLQDWPLRRKAGDAELRTRTTLICNNMDMVHGALSNGFGVGVIPDFLARESLADGSLRCILLDHLAPPNPMSMVWPSSRHLSRKIRVFVDFISARLAQEMTMVTASISESIKRSTADTTSAIESVIS
jgi:DNA-binding transcriptional LysR family regulator